MSKLKAAITLETAFRTYTATEILGEGGAGRVYGGVDDGGENVAIKVLTQTLSDKKRRFKNEIGFLSRNRHSNIVTVTDHGVANGNVKSPFYVMRRYSGNLRGLLAKSPVPAEIMNFYSQILDGVEAAHLQGVVHRDLKPENVLYDDGGNMLAIADFGVAAFVKDHLLTLVETAPTQRLANFQYAAPEQRTPGNDVDVAADIYALGLMLNEMFTGSVPHGTDYRTIASSAKDYSFLDGIVSEMIKQSPDQRPRSIADVKHLVQRYQTEAVSLQRLSDIDQTVIKVDEIDDRLALKAPVLVDAFWDRGTLHLTLDQPVTNEWVQALYNMDNYTSLMGAEPERFQFRGAAVSVPARENSAQQIIDYSRHGSQGRHNSTGERLKRRPNERRQ